MVVQRNIVEIIFFYLFVYSLIEDRVNSLGLAAAQGLAVKTSGWTGGVGIPLSLRRHGAYVYILVHPQ